MKELFYIRVQLLCNWLSSEDLTKLWSKMTKKNNTWNSIRLVTENPDYYVVINGTHIDTPKNRTILMSMEPYLENRLTEKLSIESYFAVFFHANELNNMEWHLSLSYFDLLYHSPTKTKVISSIQSNKYFDPGHKLRIDFCKYLDNYLSLDMYGDDVGYKNCKGKLPYHCKDDGLFPYKYTIAAENHSINNYITEKLWDSILSETLCFYWGCPNIEEFVNERCFVWLDMANLEESRRIIETAIKEDWWKQRIDVIRREKKRILNEYNLFERLERLIL